MQQFHYFAFVAPEVSFAVESAKTLNLSAPLCLFSNIITASDEKGTQKNANCLGVHCHCARIYNRSK